MEAENITVRLSVIEAKISDISQDLNELREELKNRTETEDFLEFKKDISQSLQRIEEQLNEMAKNTQTQIYSINMDHKLLKQNVDNVVTKNENRENNYRKILLALIPILITTATTAIIETITLLGHH